MLQQKTEDTDASVVARENGFDSKFLNMQDDDHTEPAMELHAKYAAGADGMVICAEWQPEIPEGWRLADKYDTEEGPVAMFIRKAQ